MTAKERLVHIIDESYNVLIQKIASNGFRVINEANMQHEFGMILKSLGSLYEFTLKDRMQVQMEFDVNNGGNITSKTSGKPRCDIYIIMTCSDDKCSAAIELKFFRYDKLNEAVTDNKFALYQDIENLESYEADLKYAILYTDNPNYSIAKNNVKFSIADTINAGRYEYTNKKPVVLTKDYITEWSSLPNQAPGTLKHYFMRVVVS